MTLAHKVWKACRWETYSRGLAWGGYRGAYQDWRQRRQLARVRERSGRLDLAHLRRGITPAALEALRGRCAESGKPPDALWSKYLDIDHWLSLNVRYAHEMGLVASPPRSVLDLGCGGGFFLAVCRQLGARTLGLDLDGHLVFNELIKLLQIERVDWRIRPFEKLPAMAGKFDLITGFMVCFNLAQNPKRIENRRPAWGTAEWDFFLADLVSRLEPAGRILLSLNRQPETGELYSGELRQYFESRGALIDGKRLTMTAANLVRTSVAPSG